MLGTDLCSHFLSGNLDNTGFYFRCRRLEEIYTEIRVTIYTFNGPGYICLHRKVVCTVYIHLERHLETYICIYEDI
jgi:hypothetical protein